MKFVEVMILVLFALIFITILYNTFYSSKISNMFSLPKLQPVPDKDVYPGCPLHDEYE
tara:strand:+ start:459 stop:632 length:174 start_codon:yes stop_codon:yes gene_type:complete